MRTIKRISTIPKIRLQPATLYINKDGVVRPVKKHEPAGSHRTRTKVGVRSTAEGKRISKAVAKTYTHRHRINYRVAEKDVPGTDYFRATTTKTASKDRQETMPVGPVGMERGVYDKIVQERWAEGVDAGDPREILATARARIEAMQRKADEIPTAPGNCLCGHPFHPRRICGGAIGARSMACRCCGMPHSPDFPCEVCNEHLTGGKLTDTPAGTEAKVALSEGQPPPRIPVLLDTLTVALNGLAATLRPVLRPAPDARLPRATRSDVAARISKLTAEIFDLEQRVDL